MATRSFSRLRSRIASRRRPSNRVAGSRRVALLYHRVALVEHDPFSLAIRPEWFQDHLDILATRSQVVPLDELLDNDSTDAVLTSITFDDGYVDNLTVAAPMLHDAGLPATFFICTGSLGDERGFWWDRVASAIAATSASPAAFAGLDSIPEVIALTSDDDRARTTLAIASVLQPLPPDVRDDLVDKIERRLPARSGVARTSCPILDVAAVRELASQPMAVIGAHTERHPMLSRLTAEEQLAEIAGSVRTLASITGRVPSLGAYPYGAASDYNDESCNAAREAGLRAAFVNHGGRFDPAADPFRVPRTYVPPLAADDFRAWLDNVLAR